MIRRILVVTGGHRVAMDEFLAAIADICTERGWVWAHSTQPSAQRWLTDELAGQWDAILLHDIPGLTLEIHEIPGKTPVIFMEVPPANGGSPDDTVLLYGHLDKQPELFGWREGLDRRW